MSSYGEDGGFGEDEGYIEIDGQGDGSAVDYIYAGDNNDLDVYTSGDGVVVDFGLHATGRRGQLWR